MHHPFRILEKEIFRKVKHIFLCLYWFFQSLMKTSVIYKCTNVSQKKLRTPVCIVHCLNFPLFWQSRCCWLIDYKQQQKLSETPRNLSLWPVFVHRKIMKALAALLCLFIVSVSGLDNESCEDRGNFTLGTLISRPREKFVKWQWFTRWLILAFWPTFYLSSKK